MDKRSVVLPFRITPGAVDIVTGTGDELRATRIEVAFGMRATSAGAIGEVSWDHDRGCRLDALRNAATSSAVADFAALYLEEALATAAPSERLREVHIEIDNTTISIAAKTALAAEPARTSRTLRTTATIKR